MSVNFHLQQQSTKCTGMPWTQLHVVFFPHPIKVGKREKQINGLIGIIIIHLTTNWLVNNVHYFLTTISIYWVRSLIMTPVFIVLLYEIFINEAFALMMKFIDRPACLIGIICITVVHSRDLQSLNLLITKVNLNFVCSSNGMDAVVSNN